MLLLQLLQSVLLLQACRTFVEQADKDQRGYMDAQVLPYGQNSRSMPGSCRHCLVHCMLPAVFEQGMLMHCPACNANAASRSTSSFFSYTCIDDARRICCVSCWFLNPYMVADVNLCYAENAHLNGAGENTYSRQARPRQLCP